MDKSSDSEFAFGLSGEQIRRLLSFGYDKDPENIEPHPSSSDSEHKSASGSVDEAEISPRIDGYEVIEKIAEAGQGQVWRALQHSTGRHVAIKIPRLGTVISERARIRFEREIELVARLKHPNIARIYDSGMNHGQYYYIMDFVEGSNLDEYVRQKGLTHRQILELMRTICQAVQHAHQNGIIHRDLKPANFIVTKEGRPVIVDFGLAKGFWEEDQNLVVSMDGETVGTPAYMSPEQAAGHIDKVDTRTDVYSLGVTLYTLLTGKNPHDLSGSRLEVMHRKAEQEVIRPRKLNPKISKDIEALLLKALDKDPDRRYSTAEGLAEDIDNFLKGEPLFAGPTTTFYRLKKLVRRHKSLVASLIAVFAVLTAGVIVSSVFAIKAERQAKRSDAIVDFLTDDVLSSARQVMGRDATAIDLLNAASVKLDEGAFKDQPHTELLVRYRLGNLIKDLGYSKKAIPYLERVQEIYEKYGAPKPLSRHLIMNYLGLAYLRSGEREKAEALFRQIVEEKEETNDIYTDLYPWAKQRLAEIYRMKAQYTESESILLGMMKPQFRKGEGLPPIYMVRCMRDLAETYRGQGRYEEAEQMYIKIQEMGNQVPSIPAKLHLDMGRYGQAEELLRAAIERIPDQVPGKDPMQLMRAKNDLAVVLTKQGDFEEAERLFTEVLKVRKERWSDDHPDTLTTINAFGVLRREQKKYEEAESLLRQALDGRLRKLGKDYLNCFESMHELAILYKEQARYEEAEKYFIEALEGRRLKLGDTHPHTVESLNNLIDLYEAWGKPEKAEEWRAKLPQIEAVKE